MSPSIKRELTQVSSWVGVLIGIVGNLLPRLTPDVLAALGFSPTWVSRISTGVMLLLIVYREKPKPEVLPSPTAEATRSPFFKPQSEIPK